MRVPFAVLPPRHHPSQDAMDHCRRDDDSRIIHGHAGDEAGRYAARIIGEETRPEGSLQGISAGIYERDFQPFSSLVAESLNEAWIQGGPLIATTAWSQQQHECRIAFQRDVHSMG